MFGKKWPDDQFIMFRACLGISKHFDMRFMRLGRTSNGNYMLRIGFKQDHLNVSRRNLVRGTSIVTNLFAQTEFDDKFEVQITGISKSAYDTIANFHFKIVEI